MTRLDGQTALITDLRTASVAWLRSGLAKPVRAFWCMAATEREASDLSALAEVRRRPLYLIQAAAFVGLAILAHLPPVRMGLVSEAVKRRRASRLAREQFFEQGLHLTRGRTGVLIFVSVDEHYVEIIADEGINTLVPPGTWDGAVTDFVERVRAGKVTEGFLAMIEMGGTRLAEHFPRAADDRDELPNRLIEI